MTADGVAWRPDPAAISATNVGRFMAATGVESWPRLLRRSIDEPEWFWPAVIDFLGLPFTTPFAGVVDTSRGIEWATWFLGGRLNLADWCVDRCAVPADAASAHV